MTVAVPEPSREVARADTDSWVTVMQYVIPLAERIADTEFVPKGLRGSVPAVTAAILYGREVGLPPMTSLTQTHVIEGKPAVSAEAMRAMVLAAGHEIDVVESTGAVCKMRGKRRGSDRWSGEVAWSIDGARAAGLTSKTNWKSYPRQMLQARATAELCRLVFPDVIHGFRAVEEFDESEDPAPETLTAATTKVTRGAVKRAARKALPAPEKPTERPESSGPPLPGEDGYEDVGGGAAGQVTTSASGQPGTPAPAPVGGEPEAEGEAAEVSPPTAEHDTHRGPRKASRAQLRMIFARLGDLEIDDVPEERHLIASKIVGRDVASFNDLLSTDAKALIDTLARVDDKTALNELLDAIDAQATHSQENTDDGQ